MMRSFSAWVLLVSFGLGCSTVDEAAPVRAPIVDDTSGLCVAIRNQFVPLPADLEQRAARGSVATAGRWLVRHCATAASGPDLRVTLEGPAWYWVDRDEGSFRVHQHVHFRARADLVGRFEKKVAWQDGVVSLWFLPTSADVQIEPLNEIRPSSRGVVGSMLKRLVDVPARARALFDREATAGFEQALRRGYTLVYDVQRGQPDFALDLLDPGELPPHPFDDGKSWLANERLMLAPGGAQVLGPFEPDDSLVLDTRFTRGAGISYGAVCASELLSSTDDDENALLAKLVEPRARHAESDSPETTEIPAPTCPFYLVMTSLDDAICEADVRVRPL